LTYTIERLPRVTISKFSCSKGAVGPMSDLTREAGVIDFLKNDRRSRQSAQSGFGEDLDVVNLRVGSSLEPCEGSIGEPLAVLAKAQAAGSDLAYRCEQHHQSPVCAFSFVRCKRRREPACEPGC
jgi:hypothetical protein